MSKLLLHTTERRSREGSRGNERRREERRKEERNKVRKYCIKRAEIQKEIENPVRLRQER